MRKEKVFNQSEALALAQRNENQQRTIVELKRKCDALTVSGEEMGREITHLKRVIAGQKGKIKQLANEVEKWKKLEKEGNEVYEECIAEKERLKSFLDAKEKIITDKDKRIDALLERNKRLADELVKTKDILDYHNSLPWYKRLFGF